MKKSVVEEEEEEELYNLENGDAIAARKRYAMELHKQDPEKYPLFNKHFERQGTTATKNR
jgi:hypothetical protein